MPLSDNRSNDPEDHLPGPGSVAMRLALATFGLLTLELAVIRWMSSQIRIFAYLNNLVLIAAFLGMGLGVAAGRKRPKLFHALFPALLIFSAIVGTASETPIGSITFPDLSIYLWGSEAAIQFGSFAASMSVLLGLFWLIVGIFFFAGTAVGHYFARGATLTSYSLDLAGSLAGVLGFALVTSFGVGPAVWLGVGGLPLLLLSRRVLSVGCMMGVLAFGAYSGRDALFSPYNRIEVTELPEGGLQVEVNRDFHQFVHDLSDARVASEADSAEQARFGFYQDAYGVPYTLAPNRGSALIVGAGTGNDAAAALRGGFGSVTAVDIDPVILDIGVRMHPEQPYSDPAVQRVVNDGRAFLEQYEGPAFDVVSFGLVDSHAMFSSMSSLRLENYLYSREGLRAAWENVAEDGLLVVTFSIFGGEWISDRMYWTLAAATERLPIMVHHGMNVSRTFVVARNPEVVDFGRVAPFPLLVPRGDPEDVFVTTDDWPFLYLRPGEVPWGYITLLLSVLATTFFAVGKVFGKASIGARFDAPLFFMGAAFLLLETRGVTVLSLLFGSTWTVNVAVFAGILATALAANLWVARTRPAHLLPWFVPLFLALAVLWLMPVGALNEFSLLTRGVLGGVLIGLPVGFAGVIVSMLLDRSVDSAAALGSNLLGAVLGGCLEYLSMSTGLRALVLLAAVLYAAAMYAWIRRTHGSESPAPSQLTPSPPS